MEDSISKANCSPLALSALRLLVPPIRLVSAAIWQTFQQKVVADYGRLEEFISMVTDIVPELLTARQRAQLLLGLRGRLILELCQFDATASFDLVQPHLDRLQMLIQVWEMEAGAAHMEKSSSEFVDLVKNLLENPDERKHFFQKVFPEEFGPTYDDTLHTLMWMFLSRLEQFLPLQTFQQVASMLGEVPSVLEECMDSVSQCEELKTLLQYQKDLHQFDHNDGSFGGTCILSALKVPSVEGTEMDKPQANILGNVLSCTSHLEKSPLASPHDEITEDPMSDIMVDETNRTPGHEENAGPPQSQVQDALRPLKQCCVQLKRLDMPSRPERRTKGTRMKMILLEEKRGLYDEVLPAYKFRKTKPSNSSPSHISDKDKPSSFSRDDSSHTAPISNCSDNDSWSYYSDEDSFQKTDSISSWSNYSGDESPFVTPVGSPAEDDSLSCCSNEDPSFMGFKNVSTASRKQEVKASTPKKPRKVLCFICNEPVNKSLKTHMKIHFPTGDYACPRCDSRFKLITSLRLHLSRTCFEHSKQQVDPQKPDAAKGLYKCDKCDEAFRYKVSLNRHKRTHNELYCSVCRKVLQDAAALARHKASHTSFQCNRCEETFAYFKPLLRHCQNIHKISRPFKCNYCPKVVPKLGVLIAHEWKHTGHLPFQCALCFLRFRNDGDLTSHERVHTREKPYLCAECGKTFSQKSNLLRHLNLIHGESRNKKSYSCTQCEKSYKEKGALKKHQRSKHLNELFRHPCPYCGKMFSASSIARHKLIHTGERPYKCTMSECDKHFRSNSEMKRHVLIQHSTERPYKCDVCGKGFVQINCLNTHAKIHSGEKPFVCHCCGKAFLKRYSMQRHKKLVHAFVTH